ncbi:MAG: glycoside hydrolase family 127 protein [Candidatus Brocadiia bacterium]|nr:glycoside hydrolase family 127 protein [Candidatus Brocadiia bacterium]
MAFQCEERTDMLDHNPMDECTRGERYEADVPDTLDLADRMDLAINALTNVWYPEEKWALGFFVSLSRRPAELYVSHVTDAYLNIPPKFLEALALCRLGSGSTKNLDVDKAVLEVQLGLLGEDGLTYCPTGTLKEFTEPRPFAEVWGEGRMLLALSMLMQVDDDPRWVEIGRRKVDRMLALTSEREGFRFLWKGRYRPGESVPADADEPSGAIEGGGLADRVPDGVHSTIYSIAALGHGSAMFYRVTGYEPALELSRGLARWGMARVFKNEDGRWDFWHFHTSTAALLAIFEYGYAAGDREALERVDACYRWAREIGDPLIGYYTEVMPGERGFQKFFNPKTWHGSTVELCEVADMVALALYLTKAGMGDYWDDADRWMRNVYAQGQLLEADFLDRLPDDLFIGEPGGYPHTDTRDVAARSVGSFFGCVRPESGLHIIPTDDGPKMRPNAIMHCCTANGARTLYYVWDSIVERVGAEVRVNLLLNRASPWLDVDSYLPAEGKVVLRIKTAEQIAVRMPEWCRPRDVQVSVGGETRAPVVEGKLVRLHWLRPGDCVTLEFPMPERVIHRMIVQKPYKLVLRGSNVVSIDPKGVAYPFYADQPTGKTVRKTRFVPEVNGITW